jgi:tol-pal system protein YbgF
MKRLVALSVVLAGVLSFSGCATSGGTDVAAAAPPPQAAPVPDAHVDDLQKAVAELADRLEVMSDRLQRIEAAAETPVGKAAAVPAVAVERRAATAVQPAPSRSAAPAPAPQTVMPPPRTAARALGPVMEEKYRRALTLYGQGKTADARRAFQDVFDSDPAGELADNALYWLGETFFAAGNYNNALTYYQRVVKDYSDQNKAPDALFKSGMAYEKMGDLQLAKRAFDECIARYPYSTPAASARTELKRIKY